MGNPMSLLSQLMGNPTTSMSAAQPPINPTQFKQFIPKLDNEALKQVVIQARQQGISDIDIEKGLEFIMQMR